MKRDRFDCLLKFLHLSNNEDPAANGDRLFKVNNIINLICNQFKQTLSPAENIVIDESVVPWRGRLVFRQYLPTKAHKYGVKLYKICTTEGFTYDEYTPEKILQIHLVIIMVIPIKFVWTYYEDF
ncbi:hypothetical protein NQ314_011354 [Rhamnusium bicolor]|uniref:PiggyBac transposable element-derived protein domain-containing protein n=1 Tax=Rhamnusium bicolor TaxID=1586634 RepID=A0AAV8XIU7_9CUCU|nr:hypothetical protein NQ314_011354 [Rhamnusium bicolor]